MLESDRGIRVRLVYNFHSGILYFGRVIGRVRFEHFLQVSDLCVGGEFLVYRKKKKIHQLKKKKKKDRMGEEALSSPKNKVKFLCSHGGKILPRPSDGQLKYVGGETRVVAVPRNITFPGKFFFFSLLLSYGPVELKDIVHLHMVQMQSNS